jgi:PAS domain S-box-containing protein
MVEKMASRVVTFRLPEDLVQAIISQAKATGKCKTAVVVEALKQVFGFPVSETPPASLEGLNQQIDSLREKVTCLNKQLVELTQEGLSDRKIRSIEELNQALAAGQDLLDEVSLPLPSAFPSQNVGAAEDFTEMGEVVSQESEPVSARSYGFEEDLQQLTAKVEQRARMLEQVLSASVDQVCMYDRLGRYTYANRAFMQSFGLEQTELYGKTWQQVGLPPKTMKPFDAKLQIALGTGQSIAEEISLPTVSGVRHYEYILSPIHSTEGGVEAVVYTARDITERKQAEEALRESEKNYRNLFEWAHDSIFITDSSTHSLLDVNEHAARRLGYTRKQLLHLPAEVISPPMDPNHRQAVLRQLWRTGSVTFEHVHKCKNGMEMPVEISSRVVEYGGQLAIQSFVRDITARKQAELGLQESQRFIQQLAKTTPYLIYISDLIQQRYIYLNDKANEFYGQTPEAIQGMGTAFFEEFLHPDDFPKLAEIKSRLATAAEGEVVENEFRMKNAKGQWCWFHTWEVVFSRTREGLPEQVLGTAIDITERKQVEERLEACKICGCQSEP